MSPLNGYVKYDMPGFALGRVIVAGYAAFSKQCGLYVDSAAISECADEIAALKLKATKTGVTFSVKRSISRELVEKLAMGARRVKGL